MIFLCANDDASSLFPPSSPFLSLSLSLARSLGLAQLATINGNSTALPHFLSLSLSLSPSLSLLSSVLLHLSFSPTPLSHLSPCIRYVNSNGPDNGLCISHRILAGGRSRTRLNALDRPFDDSSKISSSTGGEDERECYLKMLPKLAEDLSTWRPSTESIISRNDELRNSPGCPAV